MAEGTGRQQSALTSTRVTYGSHFMQVLNNHGGGYSYRVCPAGEKLTEECFQKHPLDFVHEQQAIVDRNNKIYPINGTFISEGTEPAGSE